MINYLFRVGDKVVVTIPQENREWGYNPCSDGAIAEVVGFGEYHEGRYRNYREPGVYENKSWITIKDETGKTWNEYCGRLELVDKEESKTREKQWRAEGCPKNEKLIRELPEDKFYPLDRVTANLGGNIEEFIVAGREHGWENAPYRVDYVNGGCTYLNENLLTLKSRGNCWNYYHNLPLSFKDLKEEAEFYKNINQTVSIPNPNSPELPYSWTLKEALDQIKLGNAHALSMSGGWFGAGPHLEVVKFNDSELGKRVAQFVLSEFTDSDFIEKESEKQLNRRSELLEICSKHRGNAE